MTATLTTNHQCNEVIHWRSADELPDSDLSVLVYAPEATEPVWIGFWDGQRWVSDGLIDYPPGQVKAWADLPAGSIP